jgi:hypothetical protein
LATWGLKSQESEAAENITLNEITVAEKGQSAKTGTFLRCTILLAAIFDNQDFRFGFEHGGGI